MNKKTVLNGLCAILGIGSIAYMFMASTIYISALYAIVGASCLYVAYTGFKIRK